MIVSSVEPRFEMSVKTRIETASGPLLPRSVVLAAPAPDEDGWRLHLTTPDGRPYTLDVPKDALSGKVTFDRAVKRCGAVYEYWFARNTLQLPHAGARRHVMRICKVDATQFRKWGLAAFAALPAGPPASYGPASDPASTVAVATPPATTTAAA
ncbi:hypothetical protein [Nocardia asiatica]|uniref:hypothetical protein n=1 Tax=Nocardia asiatica TaxID=209252 RepID=UPI000305F14A|nr:hypothetical protein [Nocardia asiatica]